MSSAAEFCAGHLVCERVPPNPALHLTGAPNLVSRGMTVLQAAPAGEPGCSPAPDSERCDMRSSICVALLAAVVWVGQLRENESSEESKKLQGTWVAASAEVRGREEKPLRVSMKMGITGTKVTITRSDREQPGVEEIRRMDPSKTPKQIDPTWERRGKAWHVLGLYKLDGDTLTLCTPHFVSDDPAKAKRPPAFTSEGGEIIVYQRERK